MDVLLIGSVVSATAVVALVGGTTWLVLFPPVPRDLGGVPDLDGEAERVRIRLGGGGSIDAWHLPGTNGAEVLLLHGYGRNHHRMWRYAAFLRRAGYGVLACDFRSAGRWRRVPTTLGHHELQDAQAALDWLRARCAGCRLAVFGESLGGSVALRLAADNPDLLAVVADCAFANGRLAVEESVERWARLPRWPVAPLARWAGHRLTGHDPWRLDAVEAAAALGGRPVFFIHSGNDNRLSTDQAEALWRAAGGKDPLWIVPGVGHNEAWLRERETYEERVRAFLDAHLLGGGRD